MFWTRQQEFCRYEFRGSWRVSGQGKKLWLLNWLVSFRKKRLSTENEKTSNHRYWNNERLRCCRRFAPYSASLKRTKEIELIVTILPNSMPQYNRLRRPRNGTWSFCHYTSCPRPVIYFLLLIHYSLSSNGTRGCSLPRFDLFPNFF